MHKPSLLAGSLLAMLAVIFGAFGAHYLKTIFTPELLSSFETGVKYQMYHSVALLVLGLYAQVSSQSVKVIFGLFLAGIILFSGSIYLLCLLKSNLQIGLGGLGVLTPIGGLLFISAWLVWFIQILKTSVSNK
jgi:uncharacterized membrane protein YgdD (TMEM256/DUF423 family)